MTTPERPARPDDEPAALLSAGHLLASTDLASSTVSSDTLAELQAELDRARHEAELGRSREAEAMLRRLLRELEVAGGGWPDPAAVALLHGTASVLLGEALVRMDRVEESKAAFRQAATSFEKSRPATGEPSVRSLSDYGVALAALGRSEEAVDALSRVVGLRAATAQTYHYLGVALAAQGRPDEAEEALRAALELEPVDPLVLLRLAELLQARGRRPQAAAAYGDAAAAFLAGKRLDAADAALERGLTLDPEAAGLLAGKGELLRQQGRHAEAVEMLERSLGYDPRRASALYSLGAALHALGRNDAALQALDRSLALASANPHALDTKVNVLIALGQLDEALQAVGAALALRPESSRLLVTQGLLLRVSGRDKEALDVLGRAVAAAPDNATAHAILADILRELGRADEALAVVDQVHLRPGDDGYALLAGTRGQVLRALGRTGEAAEELRRAVAIDDTLGWAHAELGESLRQLGRLEEALPPLDRALALAPDNAWTVGTRGQVLRMLGRTEEAVEVLRRAAELDPGLPWVHEELANALRHLNRFEEALPSLDRALALAPDNAWTVGTRGQVLRMLGRTEEAAEELRRAIAMDETLGWAHAELGESLRQLDRYEEALAALDRAAALGYQTPWLMASAGAVLQELDRHEEALVALDWALTSVPTYAWALAMKASVLCDIAEYEEALSLLDRAIELDGADWMLGLKGWALRYLETGRPDEVRDAYEQALRLDPTWPWYREGRAEALWMLGDIEQSEREYRAIVTELTAADDQADAPTLALIGWCHFMLREYHRAAQLLARATQLQDDVAFRFDLALALLGSGSSSLSLQAYRQGLEDAARRPALRRRGLFQVAWGDLAMGVRLQPSLGELPVVREIRRLLTEHMSKVWHRTPELGSGFRLPGNDRRERGAMASDARELKVQIEPPADADAEELATLAIQLRRELNALDVHSVQPERAGEVPEGAKAVEVLALGALIVKLGPVAIGAVARVVQGWLKRSAARSAELRIDGDVIKLTGTSSQDQERLIALLEAKHGRS